MDKDQIILILLIAMALVLIIEIVYILVKKKRRKEEMSLFRKSSEPVETLADKAHNLITTAENISSTLARQGINTTEADSIISQAKRFRVAKNYTSAIEQAEAAKLVMLRLKREHEVKVEQKPAAAFEIEPGRRPMDRSIYESDEPGKVERTVDSLPANYVQAKFMLSTTKDIVEERGIVDGQAYDFYTEAVSAYKREDYTKALSLAVKAEKILDSGTLTLIGEEKPRTESGAIEILVCPGCESEVSEEDSFCRECGQNLAGPRECPGCGADVIPADKFCRKCGTNLK